MKKRGQITIFIIIAVIIIAVIFVLFFVNLKKNGTKDESDNFYSSVNFCIKTLSIEGLSYLGMQGGYDSVPDPKENYSIIEVPIYWNLGKDLSPDKKKIESELNNLLKRNIPNCINISGTDFKVDSENILINSVINEKNVNIKIKYPISVKKGDITKKYEDFSQNIDSKIGLGISFSKQIINEQKKDSNKFPIGYITDLSDKNNFYFETVPINENELMINLIFDKDSENPFIFAFINKYAWMKK
jgi:hypothetical protein